MFIKIDTNLWAMCKEKYKKKQKFAYLVKNRPFKYEYNLKSPSILI